MTELDKSKNSEEKNAQVGEQSNVAYFSNDNKPNYAFSQQLLADKIKKNKISLIVRLAICGALIITCIILGVLTYVL